MERKANTLTRRDLLTSTAAVAGGYRLNHRPVEKKEVLQNSNEHLFGISSHAWWIDGNPDEYIRHLKDLRVSQVRLALDWKRFEPSYGVYNFSIYDNVLSRLHEEGMDITGNFVTVPLWAVSNPKDTGQNQLLSHLPRTSWHETALRMAIREAVTRYTFIKRWEVWNEPEMWPYFGQRDAADYLRVLRAFYQEAKSVNPEIQVAAASLLGWDHFLLKLYEIAPDRPWDAVTFHPYAEIGKDGKADPRIFAWDDPGTDLRTREIDYIHEQMVRWEDGDKPVWITEYGWDRYPEEQARRFKAAISWMSTRRFIKEADLHMLHDAYDESNPQWYGLMSMEPFSSVVNKQTRLIPKNFFYDEFKSHPRKIAP